MNRILWAALVGLALATQAQPLKAQSGALALFGYGGRDLPLSNLDEEGDHLRADWMAGGGVAVQLSTNFAVRGSFAIVENGWEGTSLEVSDSTFKRTFVSLDLQAGAPLASGFVPYFIAGAGWVKIDPQEAALEQFNKFAARFGTGVNYVIDNSFLALILELDTWIYHLGGLGYNRVQYDITIIAGLAVAVPL
ncbi:MAG: outer membrane beta-barrel protein [Gemmatimonadota bacterium]|nr:MAG: outer membrane beta-barrel protein [Gemmatimonadota bacterium]